MSIDPDQRRLLAAAIQAPHLQLQQYSCVAAGQIAHLTDLAFVPAHLHPAAAPARRFFGRRFSVITRTFGAPNTPRTVGPARKPANEYVSQTRRKRLDARAIRNSCQIASLPKCTISAKSPLFSRLQFKNRPLDFTKTLKKHHLIDSHQSASLVKAHAFCDRDANPKRSSLHSNFSGRTFKSIPFPSRPEACRAKGNRMRTLVEPPPSVALRPLRWRAAAQTD